MLDKSVPYMDILMHRSAGTPVPEFPLPCFQALYAEKLEIFSQLLIMLFPFPLAK